MDSTFGATLAVDGLLSVIDGSVQVLVMVLLFGGSAFRHAWFCV